MAAILNTPPEEFMQQWSETYDRRTKGGFPDYAENIKYICRQIGIPFEDGPVERAARLRIDLEKKELTPREEAIDILTYLKSNGYMTGLISECSLLVPEVWQDTPFAGLIDVTVFSCSLNLRKPHPEFYRLAVERLDVTPQDCLYIADGMSGELAGAINAEMEAVRIQTPKDDITNPYREEWHGTVISSLKEVLSLLE
jgi:putative hydrolase of the HAD superfamily